MRVSGRGLEYGEVNEFNEFSIYTREAGAGGLSIAVEGPSKAEISFKVSLIISRFGKFDHKFTFALTPTSFRTNKMALAQSSTK